MPRVDVVITTLLETFKTWDAADNDPNLEGGSIPLVLYLARKLYNHYEPAELQPFLLQLDKWLGNVPTEADKKTLLSLLTHIFFAGPGEFGSLYRAALTNILRWLAELTDSDISDPNLNVSLTGKLEKAWMCPITDSLRINSFLKINGISGHDHRPHWRSLAQFGEVKRIEQYITLKGIEFLVLLEDFIGSGNQIRSTVDFVCTNFTTLSTALCPLIICPEGDRLFTEMATSYPHLTYLPTMVLPNDVFLGPIPKADEPTVFARGRELTRRLGDRLPSDRFGYRDTGALVVLFSNCPDNTLALFRHETTTWAPLFPRVRRPE
jgi:hypothetical protein